MTNTEPLDLSPIVAAFGLDTATMTPLNGGLIHQTWQASTASGDWILQSINTYVFPEPELLIRNYLSIEQATPQFPIPQLKPTAKDSYLFSHNRLTWRCSAFVANSFTPTTKPNADLCYTTASNFGRLLKQWQSNQLQLATVLPRFHDLAWRMHQLQMAISQAPPLWLTQAKTAIQWANELDFLGNFYADWAANANYNRYPLHHDAKSSNILFDRNSRQAITPIDFDTAQMGLFFSDIGDMLRSMAPNADENEANWSAIELIPIHIEALLTGYREQVQSTFRPMEWEKLPWSGAILLYMQGLRFLTDFLSGNKYYQTSYAEQNLSRALNQFHLCRQYINLLKINTIK